MREIINQSFSGQFIPHIFPNQVEKQQKGAIFYCLQISRDDGLTPGL